ncbi:uncharacterized protein LOC6042145 isoform X1 [Culex quinquefasciatus]|uniref:uncharacterized protein LOC6042145 isoform X1 n=1 Tax=Culex quinquefasciatus TaxID=7176 RepID=UPI0018E3F264|nr:uncharacterized protein LOC6042145 isoform X1 [Culex quinquefasciatus]XP_038111562.1 uncharacterized protein LOC6042145 isoform X1 [Culex quinquefasciatus]XP_038111563.1 uncharacterized protein LOC6042145 isoform X1 [Culex quinquefasciatus]XP_038111564.1 uncharacterized protein LOC6042145 isoform X1 [Culex quinquefasciatus]
MSMLYNFLSRGFDAEDGQYIRQSYEHQTALDLVSANAKLLQDIPAGKGHIPPSVRYGSRKPPEEHRNGQGRHQDAGSSARSPIELAPAPSPICSSSAKTSSSLPNRQSTTIYDGIDRCRRDGHRVGEPGGAPVGDGSARDQVRSDRHQQHVPVPDRHGDHHRRVQLWQPGPVHQPQLQSQLLHQGHHDRVGEEDCDLLVAADRRQQGDHVRLQGPARGREDFILLRAILVKYSYFSVRLQI